MLTLLKKTLAAISNCFMAMPNCSSAIVNNNMAATTGTGYAGLPPLKSTNNFLNIHTGVAQKAASFLFLRPPEKRGLF